MHETDEYPLVVRPFPKIAIIIIVKVSNIVRPFKRTKELEKRLETRTYICLYVRVNETYRY